MNIIERASRSAFKDSAYGIIKAGEVYYANRLLEPDGITSDVSFTFPDATGLDIKGSRPTSGNMNINKDGKITLAISNGKWCARKEYENDDIKIDKDIENCNLSNDQDESKEKILKDIVTTSVELGVNEIDDCVTSGTCENGTSFAIRTNDNETYKFYVIGDNGSELELIMDRNLGGNVFWITKEDYESLGGTNYGQYGNNEFGPLTAVKILEERTKNWTNIKLYDYELIDDKPDYYGLQVRYQSMKRTNVRARMLTYTEANSLGCTTSSASCPTWLYENTSDLNTEELSYGYWLSTAASTYDNNVFRIRYAGDLNCIRVYNSLGVRPVIKVSKINN